jgi:pimeloyl-ACP methyl ester carboxylesterase
MTPPPTEQITVQGLQTSHATIGPPDAFPVILLHGWGAHIGLVWQLAVALADAGHRAHALDLPGFGGTEPPPQTWTVHHYAQFVAAYMRTQSIDRAHLFGHSFGGRISIVLSVNHPDQVAKVVLCDAAGVKPRLPWYRQFPVSVFRLVEGVIGDVPVVQTLRQRYRARVGSTDYLNAGPLQQTFLAVIAEDLLPLAGRIQQPTLLLWGEKDQDTPLWQAKALENAITDAGLVVFQGAGHYSYLDALPDAARVIDYFFTHDE